MAIHLSPWHRFETPHPCTHSHSIKLGAPFRNPSPLHPHMRQHKPVLPAFSGCSRGRSRSRHRSPINLRWRVWEPHPLFLLVTLELTGPSQEGNPPASPLPLTPYPLLRPAIFISGCEAPGLMVSVLKMQVQRARNAGFHLPLIRVADENREGPTKDSPVVNPTWKKCE
jgi:hypothetical protein